MSTKTNFKRVALVAVASLGLGVLTSVAPASAASAGTGVIEVRGTMCAANRLDTGALVTAASTYTNESYGTQITVPLGGSITVEGHDSEIVIVRGTSIAVSLPGASQTATANANGETIITFAASSIPATFSATALGATTLVAGASSATAATTTANKVVINVVSSCGASAWSDTTSTWEWNTADQTVGNTLSTASVFFYDNADTAHLSIWGRTSLGTFVASGVWQASVTGGCVLDMNTATASTTVGTILAADALGAETGDGIFVQIAQNAANENKPVNCTVTVSYNAATVHTRTISFGGQLASIVASKPTNALIGDESFRVFTVGAFDSAGNRVVVTPTVDAARLTTVVTNVTSAETSASGDITTGNSVVCGATAGSASVRLKATAADGTTIYSNEWTVNCAGKPATYTASLDKASYLPGDIATLTITARDSKGNLAAGPGADAVGDTASDATISSLLGATTLHTIVGSQMEHVTSPTATDAFVNGVKTYQFKVGTTEGSYAMSVAIPDIATDTAKTVAYKVAGSGSVTNADVLKAIVSLIASINKQIAALQKALLRR
jgi:hypothetical protein